MPGFAAPERPPYIPYGDPETLNVGGISNLDTLGTYYDRRFYRNSDKDFKRRHGGIVQAEDLFEQSVLDDQRGDTELMPAVQNEFMRAGLSNALGAFGGTPGTLAPGSAGEASVARNLGASIVGFQDRNRQNRQRSLLTGEAIFPRRSFGLSGADAVSLSMLNTQGENSWNQANYATETQLAQSEYNQGIAQQNADAAGEAKQQQAGVQAGVAVASILALCLTCVVAREVYGEESDQWRYFRVWMLRDAPAWLRKAYQRHGPRFAKAVAGSKLVKAVIRGLMDKVIRRLQCA